MKSTIRALSLLLSCLLFSPTFAQAAATMYGSDAAHSGAFNDGGTRPNGQLNWAAETGGTLQSMSQPVIAENVIYIASYDWKVYAFNATTGAMLWASDVLNDTGGYARLKSVAILNELVITSGDRIYALNRTTGARVWTNTDMPLDDPYNSFPGKPTISNNMIVLSDEGDLGCTIGVLDASGTTQWVKGATEWYQWGAYTSPFTPPVVHDGQIYVMAEDATGIYKVDLAGAGSYFPLPASHAICTELSYGGGNLYAGCKISGGGCAVSAFSPASLEPLWTTRFTATSSCNPNPVTVADGKVFAGANLMEIAAFDAQTGEKLWTSSPSNLAYSLEGKRFAHANGVLYLDAEDKHLYALNAATGTVLWSYFDGTTLSSSPTVANGKVYVAGYTLGSQGKSKLLALGTQEPVETAPPAVDLLLLLNQE